MLRSTSARAGSLMGFGMYRSARIRSASSRLPTKTKYRPRGMPTTISRSPLSPVSTGRSGNSSFCGLQRLLPTNESVDENAEQCGSGRKPDRCHVSGKSGTSCSSESCRLHHRKLEEDNLKKFLMIGALAFAAASIAETATAAEFYVVHDTATKKCTVVDTKPTTTTTTIVDNGTFKTKTEAETGMKSMKVCTQ